MYNLGFSHIFLKIGKKLWVRLALSVALPQRQKLEIAGIYWNRLRHIFNEQRYFSKTALHLRDECVILWEELRRKMKRSKGRDRDRRKNAWHWRESWRRKHGKEKKKQKGRLKRSSRCDENMLKKQRNIFVYLQCVTTFSHCFCRKSARLILKNFLVVSVSLKH